MKTARDSVTSTLLLSLDDGGDVGGVFSKMSLDLLATMPHDHDEVFRVKSASCSDRPRQHWSTSNLVQQLGLRRLHASAAAGSQHDDGGHSVDLGSVSGRARRHGAPPGSDAACKIYSSRHSAASHCEEHDERAPRAGVEPASLVLIQSQAGPADRPTGERSANRVPITIEHASRFGHAATPSRLNIMPSEFASQPSSPRRRARMTSGQRREQLIVVARRLFADNGVAGTSVEEIAATAGVSKPVIYEHFGSKDGLYAVVVDREVRHLQDSLNAAMTRPKQGPKRTLESAVLALLDYIDDRSDGFRIISRDSSVGSTTGSYASILSDVASWAEGILADNFDRHGFDASYSYLYAQALTGMVGMTGQAWLDSREPAKEVVAAHLVDLAFNGLARLSESPRLSRHAQRENPQSNSS